MEKGKSVISNLKFIHYKSVLIFIIPYLLLNCASVPNNKSYLNNYYDLTNILINEASLTRDSVYVFDRLSDPDEKTKTYLHLIDYMEGENAKSKLFVDNFKKFLMIYEIDYDKEKNFFKEQANKPIQLNKNKIALKKFRIQPMTKENLDKFNLRTEYTDLNQSFAINIFSYSRPVFTKNGKYAITSYGGSHSSYFYIFKKKNNHWVQIASYNSNNITIIE